VLRRSISLLLLALAASGLRAQDRSQTIPQLSPQAAFDQAVHPLDIVRRAPGNWSDVELAALEVATAQAKVSCSERKPEQFSGDDLLAYARLCGFAQQWLPVQQAASYYLVAYNAAAPGEKLNGFAGVATAFDYEIQASLHLKDVENAIHNARDMLSTVPYDDQCSEATTATVRYIQFIDTDRALALLAQRSAILLAMIKGRGSPGIAAAPSARPALALNALYADAIAYPAMQQFADQPKAAATSFAQLEAALPVSLSPDDAILTGESRRQYLLLGAPLPAISTFAWLLDPSALAPPDVNPKFGSATVLFLFPDWCAQCVAMGSKFATVVRGLGQNGARFFPLLAQANPPPAAKAAPKPTLSSGPGASKARQSSADKGAPVHVDVQMNVKPTAAVLLSGTPTLVVPNDTLKTFAATDFPLIIATDHNGIVRSIQIAPDNALVQGGTIDQLVDHILEHWPAPAK
jgi:hypothetical protein